MNLDLVKVAKNPFIYLIFGTLFASLVVLLLTGLAPNFEHRTIGISVLYGQDAPARTKVQVLVVLSGICYFLALFLKVRPKSESLPQVQSLPNHAVILGIVIVSNFLLYLSTGQQVFLNTAYALLYLFGIGLFIHYRERETFLRDFRWVLVALSYQGLITGYSLWGKVPQFNISFFVVFTLVLIAAFSLFEKPQKTLMNSGRLVSLVHACWPFMLLPLTVIIANEAQYTLFSRFQIALPGLWIWFVFLLCLSLAGIAIYLRENAKPAKHADSDEAGSKISELLNRRYLPIIIASTVAFSEYVDVIDFFAIRDFFHGGESMVPVQQLLQFGSIPYIDMYPPHGLFDMLPQLFYQLVNQTNYPESILWGEGYFLGWMPRMVAGLMVYGLLGAHLGYKTTFLVLFALPTYHLIHPYYVLLIVPAFFLGSSQKTIMQWMLFWSVVFVIFLWRVDFGVAVMGASLFVLILWMWSERSLTMFGRSFTALGVVLATASLLFVFLCLAKGQPPLHVAQRIVDYVQAMTVVAAHEKIVRQIDARAFLQYLFMPLVGVVYAAYFSSRVLRGEPTSRLHRILAFFAIVSLAISVRSLNRHSHYEGVFNPYFFTLIAALLPLLMLRFSKTLQATLFLIICVCGYAFLPAQKGYFRMLYYESGVAMEYPAPASNHAPILLGSEIPPESRLVTNISGAENTVSFLKHYLQNQQTFYDFTNSPLLYALAQKKVPSHIIETFFHTSEAIQRDLIDDLEKLYSTDNLPVVLFKQNAFWDKVDGVDNEVRSYRVVEYIYSYYLPCVSIDNYEVWLSKRIVGTQNCADYLGQDLLQRNPEIAKSITEKLRPLPNPIQVFDLHRLPFVWANFDDLSPLQSGNVTRDIEVISMDATNSLLYYLQLPEIAKTDTGNYLHLRILSAHNTRADLTYKGGNGYAFDIVASPRAQDYLIRVSTHHAWHQQDIDRMELQTESPIKVVYAGLLPGD